MASRRKTSDEPAFEIKTFTPDEIDRAIAKLKKRMAAVKSLQDDHVRYDDQRVDNETHNIRDAILEIFGPNSPEHRTHRYHRIFQPTIVLGGFGEFAGTADPGLQNDFQEAVQASMVMLQGLIARLEEKKEEHGVDSTTSIKASFEGLDLHPRIGSVCAELYRDGHYRNAVQDASIALINLVKEKARRHDLDGSGLMTTVFSKKSPVLSFNDLKDQTEQDEQEGMMHLFVGAVLALRNPRSHALMVDNPEQALEYIAFLSLLAKRVDQARRVTGP